MVKEILEKYKWENSTGTFCLTDGKKHLVPHKPLRLRDLTPKQVSIILQKTYTQRYGYINTRIGLSQETDSQIAKNLGVW